MVDARRRKERRQPVKPTSRLPPLVAPADSAIAAKQRAFSKKVVNHILEDSSSFSFSQPVSELWDRSQLTDYFEKIKEPMDLGTIKKTLDETDGYLASDTQLFDPNAFRKDARLVFLNAMEYNNKNSDLYRLANKFLGYVDKELADLPGQPAPDDEGHTGPEQSGEKTDKSDEQPKESGEDEDVANGGEEKKDDEAVEEKSNKGDEDADQEDEDMKDDDTNENEKEDEPDEEAEKLQRQIAALEKQRKNAEASLAEMELVRNVPLTHEENIKLRDEVEKLPWDMAKKVVHILRKYVDEALNDTKEADPEFVTLEFSTVEPRLLRDIEELIRPNPKVEKEKKAIANLDEEIGTLQKKLKGKSERDHGVKKKPRRRR